MRQDDQDDGVQRHRGVLNRLPKEVPGESYAREVAELEAEREALLTRLRGTREVIEGLRERSRARRERDKDPAVTSIGPGAMVFDGDGKPVGVISSGTSTPGGVTNLTIVTSGTVGHPGPTGTIGGNLSRVALESKERALDEMARLLAKARSDLTEANLTISDLKNGMWVRCFPEKTSDTGEFMVSVPTVLLGALLRMTDGVTVDRMDLTRELDEDLVMYETQDPWGLRLELRQRKP